MKTNKKQQKKDTNGQDKEEDYIGGCERKMCLKTEEDQNRQERSENMAKKKKEGLKEKSAQYINKYKD